jgi:hypothetical protein
MIRLMANLRSKAAAPAAFATEEPAERFEGQAHEPCPKTLGPWWLKALPRCDRGRCRGLSYLSMRTRRVSWFRSVQWMLSLRTCGHSAETLSNSTGDQNLWRPVVAVVLDLRAIHERGIGEVRNRRAV